MARYHHLYVIVESCSYQFGDYTEFSEYTIENCEFIFVKPNIVTRVLGLIHKYGKSVIAAWSSYLAFNSWERQIYRYIKNASFLNKIDLIHYVAPVGYQEPGYLYKLNRPYIWGPVSGFENVNSMLLDEYLDNRFIIRIKNIINTFKFRTGKRLRNVMNNSDVVIAATNSNRLIIEKYFQPKKLLYFTENLMRISENEIITSKFIEKKYGDIDKLSIIWCGSLVPRKMPNLLIDSIRKCQYQEKIEVVIVGGGYLYNTIDDMISGYKINCIKLVGSIERQYVEDYFKRIHLHILTSAYEANTTVMFEAMEYCVPSIALNHCGMADLIIHKENGIKINLTDYETICTEVANEIDIFVQHPELLINYAKNLREHSRKYVKERRAEFYNNLYQMVTKTK